ncbi:hypothetical protein L6164_033925 [Bauhinia variegata]|uniref:Uncharacterized protein n=1 Tax=Bauhinia variegata TaxID=167791 RepID=A0ACB9KTM7_BAUVA|nr:hypothetical protein L6164_033925 [Bauhinia variegata]
MQSKIGTFFKPSSVSAPKSVEPPPSTESDDDELAIWERKQYRFFNTYQRRHLSPNTGAAEKEEITQMTKKALPVESIITGRTVIKNKKRSYAQFHLDFGQSDFLLRACSICGVKFSPGDAEDEKTHNEFHKNYTHGIQFKGWTNERTVHMPNVKGEKLILVLESDPLAHRNKVKEVVKMMEIELGSGWIVHKLCKVYLFISHQRIIGCLVAEQIKEAFKVISCSAAGQSHSHGTRKKETNSCATTLQFGDIIFQREVEKRALSANDSEDGQFGGAILCESKAVAAVCGIRALWVTPSNRRKGIASQLLDAVRRSFCMGFVLERSQLAFSQPTSDGKSLASSYTGTGSFLVYKANKIESES